ncbi:MAG: hypothetical protein CMM49_00340 [Rhodospirillaceae bacterium]|nr:hypothetical protein [Rhodospirillaceae bacterium]|tara:strand:- start:114 stop:1181 length:1068 start_codon:yes stop_codon:yes gene_type:complete
MERLHSLDFLRAFAMLLGLVIHAPLIFYDPTVLLTFEIYDKPKQELWIWIILVFITNWRMPLFFFLSGFFSIMIIHKRGISKFLLDRIVRVGLTCLLFCLIFDLFDGKIDFTLDHLWFLYYLFIFAFIYSFLYQIKFIRNILTNSISIIKIIILLFCLIMFFPLAIIFNSGSITGGIEVAFLEPPKTYIDLKIGNLIYYFSFFLAGTFFYFNQKWFNIFARTKILILLSILSIVIFLLQLGANDFPIVFIILKSINTLLWCLLFLGLATRFIFSSSGLLTWLIELSYPIYLLHLMPIIFISVAFYKTGFSQINIFLFSITFGFLSSIILYYLLIKFTPLNWIVNGYSKSFFRFKF